MNRRVDFLITELEPETFHPLVKAEFEGLEDYWWVIDTGASRTVIDIHFSSLYTSEGDRPVMATGLGKEVVNIISGMIPSLMLGGFDFGAQKVALIDFNHINAEYSRFSDKKIIGLIGCDFLVNHQAVIDFKNQIILFDFSSAGF